MISRMPAVEILPDPIQLLEYQRGGVCLFNLAQKARQSKPPLMHCADWAYNTYGDRSTAMDDTTSTSGISVGHDVAVQDL